MAESSEDTDQASGVGDGLPTDALKEASQRLVSLLAQRAAQSATDRVTGLSGRLTEVAENGGTGLTSALRGSQDGGPPEGEDEDGEEKQGLFSRIGSAVGEIKDKATEALGGGGGGGSQGKKLKVTVISEDLDVGLPLRTTYDLWTQYADFPGFMKKVETVDQESEEKTNWQAKVFWSRRQWQATTIEQVPDSHISWKSQGTKGHVDGTVAFFEIASGLTRVMLLMEYWPKGLFERTGNMWRAQGRRARLEFQHFRRYAMTTALLEQGEIAGWRGEIRDSEVVKTHEDAVKEEQQAQAAEDTEPEVDEIATSDEADVRDEDSLADDDASPEDREADGGADGYEDDDTRASNADDQAVDEEPDDRYDEPEQADHADETDKGDQAGETDKGDQAGETDKGDQAGENEYDEVDEADEADDEYNEDAYQEDDQHDRADEADEADNNDRAPNEELSTGQERRQREPAAARTRRGR
jgi:hypothetical protein